MMKVIKHLFGVALLLLVAAVIFAPWRSWVEYGIKYGLAAKGFPHASFMLVSASSEHIALKDFSLGPDIPLTFDTLRLHFTREDLEASKVIVEQASARWQGGTISTQNAQFYWAGERRFQGAIKVQRVPLNELLSALTGSRARATGVVSGLVPIAMASNGDISFATGNLKTEQAGTITLEPDALPGNNEQVALVRNIMSNFHYNQLSMGIDSQHEKLSILLQLSGNNPDVYNGREVKLNVNLTGDVLGLVRQSIMPITDPKQLLRQNNEP